MLLSLVGTAIFADPPFHPFPSWRKSSRVCRRS